MARTRSPQGDEPQADSTSPQLPTPTPAEPTTPTYAEPAAGWNGWTEEQRQAQARKLKEHYDLHPEARNKLATLAKQRYAAPDGDAIKRKQKIAMMIHYGTVAKHWDSLSAEEKVIAQEKGYQHDAQPTG